MKPVTFKISQNIQNFLQFNDFNQTDRDASICQNMSNRNVFGCKTIDVSLDKEVDAQEILDIMLTFVESTIQKSNSGTNCWNKKITMRELIAVVKILYYFELTKFEEDVLINVIRQKISKENSFYALYESFLKLQESEMKEH